MILLDTDACIFVMRGHKPPKAHAGKAFAISAITEAELWVGAERTGSEAEVKRVEMLLGAVDVLPFDRAAARCAGAVIADLIKRGVRLDGPDPFIAGHALAMELSIMTGNVAHFKRVAGLKVIKWQPK